MHRTERHIAVTAALLVAVMVSTPSGDRRTTASPAASLRSAIADVEAGRRSTPLIGDPAPDGTTIVTFLATRVGGRVPRIVSDVTGWGEHVDGTFEVGVGRMRRVGRTDWYALEARVAPRARIEYLIAYAVGDYRLDPHNPRQVGPPPASEFVTPGYEAPRDLAGPGASLAGITQDTTVQSHALRGSRHVVVYSPPGDRIRSDSPVAVFLDMRVGQTAGVVERLVVHGSIEPLTVVFVDPHAGVPGEVERNGSAMRTFLGEELPEWLSSRGIGSDPARRAIIAISFGAKDAVDAALCAAGGFARVGLLIPGRRLGRADIDAIGAGPHRPLRVAILAGQYDRANIATARSLREAFGRAGDVVDYREVPEGHSPRTWLHHLRFVLVGLFGRTAPPSG